MSSRLSPSEGTREYYAARQLPINPERLARKTTLISSLEHKSDVAVIVRVLQNIQNQAFLSSTSGAEYPNSHIPIFQFLGEFRVSISEYRGTTSDGSDQAENFVDRWIRQFSKRLGSNGQITWGTEDFGKYGPAWKYGILEDMARLKSEKREMCFQKLCEWLSDSHDSLPDWDDFEKILHEISQN